MRDLLILLTMTLLATSLAAAQGETHESPQRPPDAAWVEDCAPEMMCALGGAEKRSCEFCRAEGDVATAREDARRADVPAPALALALLALAGVALLAMPRK